MVKFKPELLYEDQLKKMKEMTKVGKDKPSRFFAPNKKKEEIEKIFIKATKLIAKKFGFSSTIFSANQIFPLGNKFYTTWMSRIGRRFKAGKITDIEGLKQVYIDSIKSQAKLEFRNISDNTSDNTRDYDYSRIGKKEGSKLRDLIHQQGTVPSPYGAANIDELWAVSVEYAAMDWKISRNLKKLIYSTITGTPM